MNIKANVFLIFNPLIQKGAQPKLRTEKRSFASVATQFISFEDTTSKAYVFTNIDFERNIKLCRKNIISHFILFVNHNEH